jgi:hypothetical protein
MDQSRPNRIGSGKQLRDRDTDRAEEDDEFPITARYQRRRKISEGKRDNFPATIILETEEPDR